MNLSPSDTLEDVINRYPLTVEYFVDAEDTDWRITVKCYTKNRDISIQQLEHELKIHLKGAVRPSVDECESISCDPLPFCPEDIELPGVKRLFRGVEWGLRLLGNPFGRTEGPPR